MASSRRLERSLFHDPALVTDDRVRLGYRLATRPHAARIFVDTASTLGTIRGTRPQWRAELLRKMAEHPVPTLVVWGEQDAIFPVAHAAAASRALPHIHTRIFGSTGHLPQIERAEDFAEAAAAFWTAEDPEAEAALSLEPTAPSTGQPARP